MIRYDVGGALLWSKTWGGAGTDIGRSLLQAIDGGYVVAGYTNGYGVGANDVFLIKYDSNGILTWNRTWGGTGADVVVGYQKFIQTADGGYAMAGYSDSYGVATDVLIVKYSSSGTISNCSSPMCQSPTATVTSPSASVSSPSSSTTMPSATVTTPSATITSPSATITTVVAP